MKLIQSIQEMQSYSRWLKLEGKTIGFVPTMGYFHNGHLSLIKSAKSASDHTVVSIFVNPTQFGPKEDFSRYPRNLEHDLELAEQNGVDTVFIPSENNIYPTGYQTFIEMGSLIQVLEGLTRPGHFRGVCTIVLKLLNIIQPDTVYFGQKDAQQCIVISRMIRELNVPVSISIQPTVRESDGLALSSRNIYLTPEQRKSAKILFSTLQLANSLIAIGQTDSKIILQAMKNNIQKEKNAQLDYIAIVNPDTLGLMPKIEPPVLICLAIYIGNTRLIDNLWIIEIKREI